MTTTVGRKALKAFVNSTQLSPSVQKSLWLIKSSWPTTFVSFKLTRRHGVDVLTNIYNLDGIDGLGGIHSTVRTTFSLCLMIQHHFSHAVIDNRVASPAYKSRAHLEDFV